jgi:hypothetical protein
MAATLLGLVVASCGGTDEPAIPTPEELAASLLVVEDLGGDWSVPSDIGFPSGVLTEELVGNLPVIDLCPDAGTEAIEAVAGLRWQAGMGFILGGPTEGFAPNLIELLLAGDPSETEATFDLLKEGTAACLNVESFVEDAGTLISLDLPVPAVGDDRLGVWTRQTDQPEGSPRWDLRQVFVRRGAVILWIQDVEINPTSETVVTQQEMDSIVAAAVERLP